jgi:5-methyltetrahydropteroyltriglutamate--homocysteine methyltransferase
MEKINTSVIGSYPIDIDILNHIKGFFNQEVVSWNKYIKSAVSDMLNSGIDIVSDGQTRDPFVNIFTRRLGGCRVRQRTEIIGKIEYICPITIDDQKFVKDLIPKNKKNIGLITGPYTLTNSCANLFYKDEKELAFDFANALNQEAQLLQKHVDIIGIDEPFFSMGIPDYGVELIKTITKKIICPIRLHVCGDVSNVISEILDMPVDILSHEFKASPKLFDSFSQYDVKKNICLGSVRSDKPIIETVNEIVNHIKNGIDVFGDKITQLAPDCGQRMLPRNIALNKLKNLVKAGEIVYGR